MYGYLVRSKFAKPGLLVLIVSLLFSLVSLFSLDGAAAMPELQATGTRTPTRPLTPTPTRTLKPPDLNSQVVFGFGGGPGPICLPPGDPNNPSVAYSFAGFVRSNDGVCLFGFPEHEQVVVKIFNPSNRLVLSVPYTIQNLDWAKEDGYSLSVVSLMPPPFLAPLGKWMVRVERPGGAVTGSFDRDGTGWEYSLSKLVAPGAPWYDSRRSKNLAVGDTLLVEGVANLKNQQIPIAIYRTGNPLTLVVAQNVRTDQNGRFSAGFLIDNKFTPFQYYVKLAPVPGNENIGLPIIKYHFNVIKPIQVCPGAQPSRIQKDQTAYASAGQPNDVREKPGLSGRLVGKLYENEALEILKGPTCADGMVWWKVSSLNTGMDGWVAEGKGGDTWINSLRP